MQCDIYLISVMHICQSTFEPFVIMNESTTSENNKILNKKDVILTFKLNLIIVYTRSDEG